MNNQEKIKKLISKFYEGATTPEDEIYLYKLLIEQPQNTTYTPEQLSFIAMMETSDKISSDQWSDEDRQLADWLDNEIKYNKTKRVPLFFHNRWIGYAAAAIIVILAIGTITISLNRDTLSPLAMRNGQIISQEEASEEVQKTLQLLADCIEYTEQATKKSSETFSEIDRILDKTIIHNINNKNK